MRKRDHKKLALEQVECLKVFAAHHGISQETMANKAGMTRQQVNKFFSGTNVPRLDTFMRLCDAAGMPLFNICK